MIKPVKRNKRLKWIDSHYANFYKAGLAWERIQMVTAVATASYQVEAIKRATSKDKVGKAVAIAETFINMGKSIGKIPKVKGRVTK